MVTFPPIPQLLHGERVTVLRRSMGYDEHMEEVETWEGEEVQNVLVSPSTTSSDAAEGETHRTTTVYKLGFPKTYTGSLRGCRVHVRGHVYEVDGDPQPNDPANCPGPWWITAEVKEVQG